MDKISFSVIFNKEILALKGFYHDWSTKKKASASGGFAPWPPPRGSAPWTPRGSFAPLTIYPGAAPVHIANFGISPLALELPEGLSRLDNICQPVAPCVTSLWNNILLGVQNSAFLFKVQ